MAARPFQLHYDDLPAELPIFPLTGALLLPDGRLPLNIFEPRYLAMVEDALGARRLIGMIQPSEPAETGAPQPAGTALSGGTEPQLYDIGCAGRIASFSETGDGRFLITLAGVCRFRVVREIEGRRGYRRVVPDWKPFRADLEPPTGGAEPAFDRAKLLASLRAFLSLNEMEVDWHAIEATSDTALAIVLPMSCPFEPREKQALLECASPAERVRMLVALMEMAVAESRGGGAPVKLPKLDDNQITGLVASFAVANERMSAVHYVADYTFHFKPEETRRILASATAATAAEPGKPLIVLPVYEAAGQAMLWDDPNPWLQAWEQLPTATGPLRLVVPLGDAGDIAAIDADKALAVWKRDEELDEMYASLFRIFLTYMMEDPRNISSSTHLLFIAKNIERIGDHATNIAENVYYLVHGIPLEQARPKGDKSSLEVVVRPSSRTEAR